MRRTTWIRRGIEPTTRRRTKGALTSSPPNDDSLVAGAVDTLVSGRGVRTVQRAFSSANKTPPSPRRLGRRCRDGETPRVGSPMDAHRRDPSAQRARDVPRSSTPTTTSVPPPRSDLRKDGGLPLRPRRTTPPLQDRNHDHQACNCRGMPDKSTPPRRRRDSASRLVKFQPTGSRRPPLTLDDGRVIRSADVVSTRVTKFDSSSSTCPPARTSTPSATRRPPPQARRHLRRSATRATPP